MAWEDGEEDEVAVAVGLRLQQSVVAVEDDGDARGGFAVTRRGACLRRSRCCRRRGWGDAEGGEDERDIASHARITHRERARDASVIANVVLYAPQPCSSFQPSYEACRL